MAVIRWNFYDPVTLESVDFEVNPNTGGTPDHKKNIQTQATAAPDGGTLLMEGRDQVQQSQFSGTLLTQSQLDMFTSWFNKRHPIRMTDDLNRQFIIYITEYTTQRQRAVHYPYKHTYTVTYLVVDVS